MPTTNASTVILSLELYRQERSSSNYWFNRFRSHWLTAKDRFCTIGNEINATTNRFIKISLHLLRQWQNGYGSTSHTYKVSSIIFR